MRQALGLMSLHNVSQLPVMDGRRFRSVQLRDRSLAWIPVVVVSSGLEAVGEARELGVVVRSGA